MSDVNTTATEDEETDVQRAFRHQQSAVNKRVRARHNNDRSDQGNLSPDQSDYKVLVAQVALLRSKGEGGSDEVKRINALLRSVDRNNY